MTDTLALETAILKAGLTKTAVAEYLGISLQALYLKINNKCEFKASEIQKLCKLLNLKSKDIFFVAESD